jgi:glycosyltransferase involved in cell wall biosynthesis
MARICYFITELDIGGAEKHLFEVVKRIDKSRFTPVVVALIGRGELGRWIEDLGIRVFYLDARGAGTLFSIPPLTDILRKERPDILHTFLFHANLIGRIAGRRAKVRKVISSIRVAERRANCHLLLERLTRGLVDKEVAVSEDVRRFMIERAKINPDTIVAIPNGLDFKTYQSFTKDDCRARLSISADAFVISFVGRLDEQKRPDILLRAWAKIRNAIPNGRVIIVGDKPEKESTVSLAEKLGVLESVEFPGWRSDAIEFVTASDIFVLPSMWEGMSNITMEALAVGTPVVTTAVEGMRELLRGGECGVLVEPGNADELARAMLNLCRDPEKRQAFSAIGKKHVEENYRIEDTVRRYEQLYSEILEV